MHDRLLTYEQAGELIGRSRDRIAALVTARELTPVPTRDGPSIPESQLRSWVRSRYVCDPDVYFYAQTPAGRRARAAAEAEERKAAITAAKAIQRKAADETYARNVERAREISFRVARRENERLRRKARELGLEGLVPAHMGEEGRKRLSRLLDKPSAAPANPATAAKAGRAGSNPPERLMTILRRHAARRLRIKPCLSTVVWSDKNTGQQHKQVVRFEP